MGIHRRRGSLLAGDQRDTSNPGSVPEDFGAHDEFYDFFVASTS
ncbi:MAG: hypothetical protein ACRD2A_04225 [Vicinamibacterales bacterium]